MFRSNLTKVNTCLFKLCLLYSQLRNVYETCLLSLEAEWFKTLINMIKNKPSHSHSKHRFIENIILVWKNTNVDKFVEEEKNKGRKRVYYCHCYSTSTKPVWTSVVTVQSECTEHVYIRRQGNDNPISRIIHPAQRCVLALPLVNSATIKTLVSFSGEKEIWH